MIYIFKNDKVRTSATLATLETIYFWKWYVSLKKWQSLNIRNPRNLATYLSLKMIYIFKNDKVWTSATIATLVTYLSLKMICVFKKMTKSEHPQPSQPIYLWKWYISLKMTNSEHPQPSHPSQPIYLWKWYISLKMTKSEDPEPSQPLQPIYLWKWYISLKMTKSEHPQPSKPLQPIYLWKWYVYIFKKWQSLNIRNPSQPCNLFIFENDIYLLKWQSLNTRNPRNPCNLFIFENDMYL